jgi:acetylornithine/N-succinyldiaminopimelate aminotransferase
MENATTMGIYLASRLNQLRDSFPDLITEVRGKGLMVGLDLAFDGTEIIHKLQARNVLLNLTSNTVVRWLPPLIIRREDIDVAVEAVASALSEIRTFQGTRTSIPAPLSR